MGHNEDALVEVGDRLRAEGYAFVTPTPDTHARVIARHGGAPATTLRDVFGWSRPARAELFAPGMLAALRAADALVAAGELWQPTVRFSTLGGGLYVHSAFPTLGDDAVFFGPDTYRFCALLASEVAGAQRIVDVGAGSGAGALSLAARAERLVLTDINPRALSMARVNARLAGIDRRVDTVRADVLAGVDGPFDLVVTNPPYLVDDRGRAYRHGGGELGTALAVRIAREALARLGPGGRLVVYTGSPIVDGRDVFREVVQPVLDARPTTATYREIDPDVFGDELDRPAYRRVDRIAAVALCVTVIE